MSIAGFAGLALASGVFSISSGADPDDQFFLSFDSPGDTLVRGYCVVAGTAGQERHMIDETAPFQLSFPGKGLRCQIHADGFVKIEVSSSRGNRTRSATSGGSLSFAFGDV